VVEWSRGGALERGVWRRAGYRYGNRNGGCCGCWNKGRNGRCFGAGNGCCCGRRHEGRCGSRTGSRCNARTGCGSGRRCSAKRGRCSGSMSGGRYDTRSRDRNDTCCCNRSGCRFRRCCGRRNEGRLGGKGSPSRPGDGRNSDNAEVRMQIPEVRTRRRTRTCRPWTVLTWQRRTMYDIRENGKVPVTR
jgi:hypothetical protein